jgi:glycosyltransferase involved in cell wall biosynthesis
MSAPVVEVVIPVYNGARTIKSAIESIRQQTVRDIRIIVVNDGSSDATATILERLAAEDDRLVVVQQTNSGVVDAMNAGIAAGCSPIIARHDADDIAVPDRLAKQLAYLYSHPECVAVSGAVHHMGENGRILGPPWQPPSPDYADPARYPVREPCLLDPVLMMRRAAFELVGGYRQVFLAEDADLHWRLQEVGRLSNMQDLLGYYRIHTKSLTGSSIVSGRISAVNSQRSGISAMRRRAGRPDITFPKPILTDYQQARSLEGVIKVGCRELDASEAERLALAACAKLIELAGYRPYELESEDCAFIRNTMCRGLAGLTSDDRKRCIRMLSGTAARLAVQGRTADMLKLTPVRLFPALAKRLAARTVIPSSVRLSLRRTSDRYIVK